MALSNWDHTAWDKFGDPRNGTMVFPGNITLEIYKNWLYVHDPNMKGSFMCIDMKDHISVYDDERDKTIIEITEGEVYYKGIHIIVHGDDEHGTFIHAVYDGGYDKDHRYNACDPMVLCGIGKYGFCGNEWVGITEDDVKAFAEWLIEIKSPLKEIAEAKPYNQGEAFFCGVDKAMTRYDTAHNTVLGWMFKQIQKG